jgi:chemotaxis family two-component system response regulator Rcp1
MMASIPTGGRERPVQILIVEDSPEDVLLTREALKEARVATELHDADNGKSALDYLRKQGPWTNASRPELILLDLNLPDRDGREVLAELKQDPDLMAIPVVVLTTSASQEDVALAYKHHANAYIRKPVDLDRFIAIIKKIDEFWLGVVTLPPG